MLLLDASVWVAAAAPNQQSHGPASTLVASGERLCALDLTLLEVANAIGVKARKPDRARWMLDTIEARCGERVVRADRALMLTALDYATKHGLTAYDAAYVAVAASRGWTLVSLDLRDLVSKGLAVTPDAAV